MNMTDLKARIEAAYKAGTLDAQRTQMAYAAITAPKHYGSSMTPKARDSILTNRFGI